jgi:hypothetical protein
MASTYFVPLLTILRTGAFAELKQQGREANHLSPSSFEAPVRLHGEMFNLLSTRTTFTQNRESDVTGIIRLLQYYQRTFFCGCSRQNDLENSESIFKIRVLGDNSLGSSMSINVEKSLIDSLTNTNLPFQDSHNLIQTLRTIFLWRLCYLHLTEHGSCDGRPYKEDFNPALKLTNFS